MFVAFAAVIGSGGLIWFLERALDDSIHLQGSQEDVQDPEEDEEDARGILGAAGTAELGLTKEGSDATDDDEEDGEDGADRVQGHAEPKCASHNLELTTL